MYKKIIITFLLVFSAFLGFDRVSAFSTKEEVDSLDISQLVNEYKTRFKYVDFELYNKVFIVFYYYLPINYNPKSAYSYLIFFYKDSDSPRLNEEYKIVFSEDYYADTSFKLNDLSLTDNYPCEYLPSYKTYKYHLEDDLLNENGEVVLEKNNILDEEFTITIMDTEFDYKYGVNYVKGEQDNTIEYYLQDSGILMDTHAKGYEIDKIYYDEALTKEAFLDDVLEVDTTLYVTWKSKINITSEIKKDSSSNDVISITYDFSKIYNENYTYWISNDGENYVDITSQLNEEKKYISDVYFFGRYYARVQDETGNTISVNHIRIKYYYISINTELGSETDDEGNILPFIILDYSAYKNIKDNLIFEYSIDNGKTWVNVTNRLDSNFKYKLYVKIGDKVKTRVRTNGSTVLPGTSTGSDYVIDEDFINNLLTDDNFEFTLNKFLKPIKFIISSITEFYNDYCPPIVQNFFYLSFIILVVLFIIKLIW